MVLIRSFLVLLFVSAMPIWATKLWLGFSFQEKGARPCSLLVVKVHPQSGADVAGLRAGDLVVAMQGKPVPSIAELKRLVEGAQPGTQLGLGVLRAGKMISLRMTLSPRPEDIRTLMGSHVGSKAYKLPLEHYYANAQLLKQPPRAVLIDFWATWCGPCRAYFPILRDLQKRFGANGLLVVGVSSDRKDALLDFQAKEQVPWPLYYDAGGLQMSRWGVSAIPAMVLLGPDWIVRKQWLQGPPTPAQLESEIRKLLEEK